jgi:hypothetical protein
VVAPARPSSFFRHLELAILERRSLNLNVIFEVELILERARRNALMTVLVSGVGPGLVRGQLVLLCA